MEGRVSTRVNEGTRVRSSVGLPAASEASPEALTARLLPLVISRAVRTVRACGWAMIAVLAWPLGVSGTGAEAAAASPGWSELSPSLIERSEVADAAIGGVVYVAGGIAYPIARPGALEAYDTSNGSWSLRAPMPEDVNHAAAAPYRGSLYVLGGYAGFPENGPLHGLAGDETGRFFRYSPTADTWSELAPMPTSRGALAAAVIGDRLYAVGGYSAALGTLARLEIYDFRTGRWTRGPDMGEPREHLAAAALYGALYVFGGRDFYGGQTYATAERFVPSLGHWEQLPPMRVARAGFQAVAAGNRLVVFGGERPGSGTRGTIGQVEAFDPRTQAWTELPPMPHPRHGLGGAWDGRRVYALEGGEETVLGGSTLAEALRMPVDRAPAPPVRAVRPTLRLTVRPGRVPTGRATLVRVVVTARIAGRRRPVAGAVVRFLGRATRTDRHGSVRLRVLVHRRGSYRLRATRSGFRATTGIVRAVRGSGRTPHRAAPHYTG